MISIVIPTYKPGFYFYECLQALNNQDFSKSNFFVYIILNGKRDPYYEVINEWMLDFDLRFKMVFTDVSGVSNARNIGLDIANSEYICFLDDDDLISKNYLSELYNIAANNKLAISNVRSFSDEIHQSKDYFLTFYQKKSLQDISIKHKSNFSTIWGKLIHKNIIGNNRFNLNLRIGEDALFMFTISKNIKKIESTYSDCIYFRRIRQNSTVTIKRSVYFYISNLIVLLCLYTLIFLKAPLNYGFIFYLNRISACFKSTILFILNKHE